MRKGHWLSLCALLSCGALAQDFADYGQPAKLRQFSNGWYSENSLAMRQYALGLFAVLSKHCTAPEPIRLSANRLRTKVAQLSKETESPVAIKDAEIFTPRAAVTAGGRCASTCNVSQVERYLTEEDRKAFMDNFFKYYIKIEDERIYRLLTRLNACKR
jgi:hypothetical protein